MGRETERRMKAYARLALRVGVNLQPGQRLEVNALVEHHPFVRAVAEAAYESGASFVDVFYGDQNVRRSHIEHATDENLDWSPPWLVERIQSTADDGAALLSVAGNPDPDLFAGLDGERVARSQMRELRKATLALTHGDCNWSIVACPTEGWAQAVFGEPDVERLWEAVALAVRLDDPDPIAAWQTHMATLAARAEGINAHRFDAIRYQGPGTELTVGLHPHSVWQAADDLSRGIRHVPNMPTEEVFTTPDARRVDGTVRATYPLALPGKVVRGLELRFADGRVTEVHAEDGQELMRTLVATDDGSARLGEIALVDRDSRVGKTGLVFYDTLFDENAASHIALGDAILQAVNVEGLSPDERHEQGVNRSTIHVDFMIGSEEVDVVGVSGDGGETPILRRGEWVLAAP